MEVNQKLRTELPLPKIGERLFGRKDKPFGWPMAILAAERRPP